MAKRPEIKIDPMDEFFGIPTSMEGSAMVKIKDIYPFKDHPFKVLDDEKMDELVESIKANGVLSPVLVRPRTPEQGYEMISGHRRLHASKKAGLEYIPAIIKEMSDDEATIAMVDSNVQREEILPSERAWSFKMKMDAMNRQGARSDLEGGTSGTEFQKLKTNEFTRDKIGSEAGMTGRQVGKYIRLTELIPPLLSMVDNKELPISMAVDISYFNQEVQEWFYEYHRANKGIKPAQIKALKELQNIDNITKYTFTATMNGAVPNKYGGGVNLSERKLNAFFPPRMAAKERERIIIELLTKWKEEQK
jgi:ParB family chromosome partitioning protein